MSTPALNQAAFLDNPEVENVAVRPALDCGARLLWRHDESWHVPRAGLHLTDLRRPDVPECADEARASWITRIARRYDAPVPVRDDRLYEGAGFSMFRGQIWSGSALVEHSFHPKLRDQMAAQYAGMQQLAKRDAMDTPQGSAMYFQKPGTGNYFHWMIECLPRLSLLDDPAIAARIDRLLLHFGKMPGFITDSIGHFFPALTNRLLPVGKALVRPDRLCFVTSGPRNDDEEIETRISSTSAPFLAGLARPDKPGATVIVISRANATNRRLINEEAMIEYLSARFPVRVMIGDRLSVADQRAIMSEARAVVGVHGAGLTNTIFAPRGARLIEITSGQYVNRTASFHDAALVSGITPLLVLAEEHGERAEVVNNVGNDLYLDPAGFEKLASLIAD